MRLHVNGSSQQSVLALKQFVHQSFIPLVHGLEVLLVALLVLLEEGRGGRGGERGEGGERGRGRGKTISGGVATTSRGK